MSEGLRKGMKVKWKWGSSEAEGKIAEVFTGKVTRTIKGKEITRNASEDEPAFLVRQDDGAEALKSGSELSRT